MRRIFPNPLSATTKAVPQGTYQQHDVISGGVSPQLAKCARLFIRCAPSTPRFAEKINQETRVIHCWFRTFVKQHHLPRQSSNNAEIPTFGKRTRGVPQPLPNCYQCMKAHYLCRGILVARIFGFCWHRALLLVSTKQQRNWSTVVVKIFITVNGT